MLINWCACSLEERWNRRVVGWVILALDKQTYTSIYNKESKIDPTDVIFERCSRCHLLRHPFAHIKEILEKE